MINANKELALKCTNFKLGAHSNTDLKKYNKRLAGGGDHFFLTIAV